jgi:hypothetical protein
MTRREFSRAVLIAKSNVDLSGYDQFALFGYGLPDFEPVCVTMGAAARCLRWQCQAAIKWAHEADFFWDEKEMNDTWYHWRTKVTIVGDGSDDAASLPGRLLAQALGIFEGTEQ